MKQSAHFPVVLAVLGVLLYSLLDVVMKAQALAMGTYSAMFWRMGFGALFALLLFSPRRVGPVSRRALKIHSLRAALTTLMTYLFFFSLRRIPLAPAAGLSFLAPIITLFLAAPLLEPPDSGQQVRWCDKVNGRGSSRDCVSRIIRRF